MADNEKRLPAAHAGASTALDHKAEVV